MRRRSRRDAFGGILEAALESGIVTVAFDTLKFVEKLEAGGFSATQARAAAGAFADATGEHLATKADIAAVKSEVAAVKADVAALKADTKAEFAAVKSEVAAVKAEVAAVKAEVAAVKADVALIAAKLGGFATKDELKAAISDAKTDLIKWIFAQTLLLAGLFMAMMRYGH